MLQGVGSVEQQYFNGLKYELNENYEYPFNEKETEIKNVKMTNRNDNYF